MSVIPNNEYMLDEIAQEPELLRHILENRDRYTRDFVRLFLSRPIRQIYLIGSGSPSHLAKTLRCAAISLLGVEALAPLPSLFLHHEGFNPSGLLRPEEMLLICPVESGRTKGPVLAAREARRLGIPVVCTTLDEQGTLASLSDVVIKKPSGAEMAPPTTKGHTVGLFLMLLCFLEAARARGRLSEEVYQRYDMTLSGLADRVDAARLKTRSWFRLHKEALMGSERYWFLAYGGNEGTASEAVLKFLESHQKPTFGYELEEFLHGPLCAVGPSDFVFFLAAEEGPEKERMLQLYRAMKPSYPHCALIHSDREDRLDELDLAIPTCGLPFINALEFLVPIQVLSCEIADAQGTDVTVWTTREIREQMKPGFER